MNLHKLISILIDAKTFRKFPAIELLHVWLPCMQSRTRGVKSKLHYFDLVYNLLMYNKSKKWSLGFTNEAPVRLLDAAGSFTWSVASLLRAVSSL